MMFANRRIGVPTLGQPSVARVAIVAGLMIGGSAIQVSAQQPNQTGVATHDALHGPRVHDCGKARAVQQLLEARKHAPPLERFYLESLADTDVLHYALDIEVTDPQPRRNSCTITGTNLMTIQSKSAALSEFSFRLRYQFAITGAFVNGSTPVTVTEVSDTTRVVTLDQTYGMDDVFTLTIEYTGETVGGGLGAIMVSKHSGDIPVVSTLSEPYFSYTWWPVKDGDLYEPGDNSDKTTLEFSITVQDDFIAVANGALRSTDVVPPDRLRFNWVSGYPIAPYLVAFSTTQYNTWTAYYSHPGVSMPVEFYIYPSYDTPFERAACETVVDMLGAFRPMFGEYPFIDEKYAIYNFPFGGGMEHQTATGQGSCYEYLNAHELAHQWWGDMVTCKTWNHMWLNEGFASYAEALWVEHHPSGGGLPALKAYMQYMKYTGPGSVYVTDEEVAQVWPIFDGNTSYDKGAWVVHMLRHVLGDEDFFDALAVYRTTFEYGAATTEDLQAICEDFYGGSLEWFFHQWIYEERAPEYAWGWDWEEVEGQYNLLLYIDQTQSIVYPRFTMPIDIVVDGTTYVVFNDTDPQHFAIPIPSAPSSVAFDPDAWVLWSSVTETAYVPPAAPSPPAAEPQPTCKNRFICLIPGDPVAETAIRVKLVDLYNPDPMPTNGTVPDYSAYEGEVRWVGPPVELPEFDEQGPPFTDPTFMGASLQCEPHFADWDGVELLSVYGPEIMPDSVYEVQAVYPGCTDLSNEQCYSQPPLVINTARWGDAVEPFAGPTEPAQPDFMDISGLVDKFKGDAVPLKVQTMLRNNMLPVTEKINFEDISACVDAFLDWPYPYAGPTACR